MSSQSESITPPPPTACFVVEQPRSVYFGYGINYSSYMYECDPKIYLGFIIIYFRVGFLILLFTYVNLCLLVLLFIL